MTDIPDNNRYKFDSYIGRNTGWWDYYLQYKKVVEVIVNGINSNDIMIDTISLPLLFSIRHCLELGLKANILKIEKLNPEINKLTLGGGSHSIKLLYELFIKHIDAIRVKYSISAEVIAQIDSYTTKLNTLKDKIDKLDKGSYSFRYPVDTNGKPSFQWDTRENVANLVDLFDLVQPLLMYTDNVLADEGIEIN